MFRQQDVILRHFIAEEYKIITSNHTVKRPNIKNPKHNFHTHGFQY
jgi:hypothetical protein